VSYCYVAQSGIEELELEPAGIRETLEAPDFYRREGSGLPEAKARIEALDKETGMKQKKA
jgi:hypothetical protein